MQCNSAALEASCVATYTVDYLDYLECFPNLVQPHISRIRLLDGEYLEVLRELNELQSELEGLRKEEKRKQGELLAEMKNLLRRGQQIGDDKLKEVATMAELTENKTGQLDNDGRNFVVASPKRPDGSGFPHRNVSITGRSHFAAKNGESSRHNSIEEGGTPNSARAERHARTAAEGRESMYTERHGSGGGGHKRPRRQKQFPDFIRDPEFVGPKKDRLTPIVETVVAAKPVPVVNTPAPVVAKRKKSTGKRKDVGKAKDKKPVAPVFDTPIDPEEPVYCVCQQVSYGEMIGCDYNDCEIEWFHFSCVGLVTKPKGKWFCPNCRGEKPNSLKHKLSGK